MSINLLKHGKFDSVLAAVAAGTSNQSSSSIDMVGFESAVFVCSWGAIVNGGVQSCKIQTSTNDSNFADLLGTNLAVADGDDGLLTIIEIVEPAERYLRMIVARATQNSTINQVIAYRHGSSVEPKTQGATVQGNEIHFSPPRGTA